ncbi:MAG: cation:proton antiporter [Candidatus Diapherotrites archaeon]|nr:cation:proton antiporter [Candidatus Diapherotrites archaeon]
MAELITFFVLLFSGLVFSELFKRLHLPYVAALIVAGMIIGPVLNLATADPTMSFLGSIGIVFLMFIAGSEIKTDVFKKTGKKIFLTTFLNGSLPFLTGFGIVWYVTQSLFTALIMGIAFIASSVAIIIPALESKKILNTPLGETIVSATVFEDIASLLLLSFALQIFLPKSALPLFIYIPLIIALILLLKKIVPILEAFYHSGKWGRELFESELRFIFVTLIATVVMFEFLGVHAVIAGFLIGIILGDSVKGKVEEKIRTISYGIFIPIFFVIIGMQTDLIVFLSPQAMAVALLIIGGLFASKIFSGFIAGKFLLGFSKQESVLMGIATTPQLSTTLAVAFLGLESGFLTIEIAASLVLYTTITALVVPLAIRAIKISPSKEVNAFIQ